MRSRARKPVRTCRRVFTISSGWCASSRRRAARSACAGAVWTQERLVTLSSRTARAAAHSRTSPTGALGRSRCWCFEPCGARITFPLRTPGLLSHRGASVNAMPPSAPRLSKSRFTSGLQCHKKLWWEVHEPDAKELQPDKVLQDLFDQGRLAAACGVTITAAEVLHLNKEFRHPDTGDLFAATDVTAPVAAFLPQVPDEITRQRAMLAGPLPDVPIGLHCFEPHECPFMCRCWPDRPDHISNLSGVGPKKTAAYLEQGITSIKDLPKNEKLNFTQKRQLKAMAENRVVVEPTLAEQLAPFIGSPIGSSTGSPLSRRERGKGGEERTERGSGGEARIGFLDFETIIRAIPVWPGMYPWQQAAAQFSYHERQPDGTYTHVGYLAEVPLDARPPLAAAMVRATATADRVVTYTAFE